MTARTNSPQADGQILRRTDFDKQLTQEVMEIALKRAVSLISEVERKTPWRDTVGADDRLNDAILKTLEGTRRWDPERVELGWHLFSVVKSEISSELKHSKKFARVSLDDERQDVEALRGEVEDALARQAPLSNQLPTRSVWTLAMQALREVAKDDADVLKILDAYDRGAYVMRDVVRVSKMKVRAYTAAHRRLVELAQTVDEDIREIIQQAIA
jgi:hypothetical protein